MASQVMRITLKAYDHQLVDASAKNNRNSKEKRITGERTSSSSYKERGCDNT